ncbi:sulfatase family protein [Tunicatimonas pelagia]|uniref:sulfatase family protein n=1 Tax=Tunicatimonas pelagia TaxID=931531 RepID=UPI002666ECD2|nr:sulfatase [Tunicatimonas pelagia]WKN41227.1 sulfatase [Tunicatimonas pelagia]
MTTPNFIRHYLAVLLSVFTFAGYAQQSTDLPNIVFIYADDMGYGDVGCYGAEDIKTPNMDQIARNGIKFSEFYSVSPVCSPSRYGLMTGRYPARDGIHGVFFPTSWTGMDTTEVTMADMLKSVGYATGVVGKWHLGHRQQYLPLQRGFDYYFGIPYSNDMSAVVYLEGNKLVEEDVDQHYTTQTYTEKAVQFIDDHQDEPFFLYIPHSMPHVPIYASEQFEDSSDRGLYGDVIQELDWSVGEVLKKLQEVGVDENTIVVVSSDNGPWLTMIEHGGSAGPLRAGKQTTFEGGMRVPCVMQWKAQVEPNQTIDGMHNMMDWFPTFAAITGASVPNDRPIDGENIAPVLLEGEERGGDQFMYYSHQTGKIAAYRKGDWKIKLPMEKPYNGRYTYAGEEPHGILLFNLAEDRGEQTNLADEHPEMVAQMQQDIEQFKEELGETRETHRFKPGSDNSHHHYLKEKYGSSQ